MIKMSRPELTLPIFSHLLEPEGMAPAQNFSENLELVCNHLPGIENRAKVRFVIGDQIIFRLGSREEVSRLTDNEEDFVSGFADEEFSDLDSEAPIIRLVNHLFARALDLNASDIHFEPTETYLEVRCRVDGIMTRIEKLPIKIQSAVASRLKLMARLDIGEKRLPQDGRIDYKVGDRELDMRVSTLPGVMGESVVLRILDRSDLSIELSELGMPKEILQEYNKLVTQPHGLILITGPTGSGKTTTLYGTLEKIHDEKHKIITVEDPVEYQLNGITQIQVNSKIGLDFASGLRSIV
jgi:general secretion pathway protein E